MYQFTVMAVVIGTSDFTNFRFSVEVSDFIVTDTYTYTFTNALRRNECLIVDILSAI